MAEEELFWADQIANKILTRDKFFYTDDKVQKLNEFTVKTSASLSGVLHIGRLSDTIRGISVYKALKDRGVKTKIIWVAEDMDPLRKVPKGLSDNYIEHIGMSVTDIPDPDGCHDSYAQHHVSEYFEVMDDFVDVKMEKFSMREEYKKGVFNDYIKKLVENVDQIKQIQNKFRKEDLPDHWSPWAPICDNCGKIATPKVTGFENGKAQYVCQDYSFEKFTAKGCGHEGENDPLKGNGKLMWKSEWAAQWANWKIVSEGAGKEYQVPGSAFWINGEILEKILKFPMPEPIFYEMLTIDNVKISASLGNVIYPKDWLEVARPEVLAFLFNKRLMKTRSFSWKDLPILYEELDKSARVYFGETPIENKKEENHIKRLFTLSTGKDFVLPSITFAHAAMLSQLFKTEEDYINALKKTGHYVSEKETATLERIKKASVWLKKYAPEDMKFSFNENADFLEVSDEFKKVFLGISKILKEKEFDERSLNNEFYEICKANSIKPAQFYKVCYNLFFNRDRGPRLASFILSYGKDKFADLLSKI